MNNPSSLQNDGTSIKEGVVFFSFEQLVREKELLQGMMQHLHMKQPKAKPDPPSPQVSGLTSLSNLIYL